MILGFYLLPRTIDKLRAELPGGNLGLYIGKAGVASAYGAAGALLAILVWIYYSASILLLGAEFTKIHARHNGSQG